MKPNQSTVLLFLFWISISTLMAQNTTGVVIDAETEEPLIGAVVQNLDTTAGAVTNVDGSFQIDASAGDQLSVSYLGYVTQQLVVGQDDISVISLATDESVIEDVVVIGYGKQESAEVTGSVSTVTAETIEDLNPVQATESLQGTTAGVNVTQTSGAPGAGLNIRIRGVSTNGQNAPIAIIDGYQGDLSLLNPDDIETITVLKDAQAAIYGTIGANGVILVTTKQGAKNQAPKVSLKSYYGLQSTTRELPLLNSREYAVLLNESYAAANMPLPYPNVNSLSVNTDWQNELFQENVPIQSNNLSIQGGGENVTYIVSGSFLDQQGIIGEDKTGFYRGTGRAGVNVDITDDLKLTSNFIYTGLNRKSINESGLGSVLFNGLNAPPILSPYTNNGDFTLIPSTPGYGIEIINPLAQIDNTFNNYDLRKLNGNLGLDYELIDGLTVTGRFGFNTSTTEGKSFAKALDYGGKVFDVERSSVSQNSENFNDYTIDAFATYENTFNDVHDLTATIGSTYYKEYGNGLFATGYDVPNNSWEFADISLAQGTSEEGVQDVGSYAYDERRGSQFGRIQYDYAGKYLVSAMIRRDLSTKFGPDNRVGIFPSVTAGWILTEEDFFPESGVINFMKLRGSYGVLGNDQIPNLGYIGSLNGEATYVWDNQIQQGLAQGQLPNPALQWEESKKLDIGVDVDFLENKISLVADYFNNQRENLLIPNIPVSGIVGTNAPGAASPTVNAGTVLNEGVEFALGYKGNIGNDFLYDLNFNMAKIHNEVLEVNNETGFIEGGAFGVGQPLPTRMQIGFPIGYFLGYETDGIFQNQAEVDAHATQMLGATAVPGDLRYRDLNGDGEITPEDRTMIGSPIPDATLGFNIQTNYKNFNFHLYTYSQLGNEMIRNYERSLSDVNQLNYRLDRWTGEGTSTTVPRATAGASGNNVFSDYYVEDASFWRIQTAQLGYDVTDLKIGNFGIDKMNLYVKGNNLLTFTEYRGYDPGATSGAPIGGGIDYGFYPLPRTVLFGTNINF